MAKAARQIQRARAMRRTPSRAEDLLWRRLRGRREDGLKFRRQEPIGPFVVDFVCHEAKLVIEVDGEDHQFRVEADRLRADWLREQGYQVMRFSNEEVMFEPRSCWIGILWAAYSRVPRLADRTADLPTF